MLFDKIYHHLGMQKYLINVVRYMIQLQQKMEKAYGHWYSVDVKEKLKIISKLIIFKSKFVLL
jgi:hypothetical protein